jgi:hypothetical protein
MYFSNRVPFKQPWKFGSFTNVVIPIKQNESKGFCKQLSSKIKLTSPISWQIFELLNPGLKPSDKIQYFPLVHLLELIPGEVTPYAMTQFGLIEEKLYSMKANFVHINESHHINHIKF